MSTKYRAKRYGYKAWQIEEYIHNKKQNTWKWQAIKYPGRLTDLLDAMVDLGFGDFTTDSTQEILEKLNAIQKQLLETARGVDCIEFEGE